MATGDKEREESSRRTVVTHETVLRVERTLALCNRLVIFPTCKIVGELTSYVRYVIGAVSGSRKMQPPHDR